MHGPATEMILGAQDGAARAGTHLREGRLVAFPTETVYGVGANALDGAAVARIFEAKGRPRFNPLIVHVPTLEAAQRFATFGQAARRLADAFWPGALTLVVPLRDPSGISELVTAGLPTVGVRVPDHPLARAMLEAADVPVAAPSANRSGRISPTRAEHVGADMTGRIDAILDGGACPLGLESTIVTLDPVPTLLRPGGLPLDAIEACLGEKLRVAGTGDGITAPGQMASHYAPDARLRLNAEAAQGTEVLLGFGAVKADLNLSPGGDLREAAANLFAHLRTLDAKAPEAIAVSPIPMIGLGLAINDRLARAAAPRG